MKAKPLVDLHKKASDPVPDWTIGEAEALLRSLKGVLSSRVVARPGGEIDEIHLLTTYEVTPKQTVRNVESALRAHFDLRVDHRKISVAQTTQPGKYATQEDEPEAEKAPEAPPAPPPEPPIEAHRPAAPPLRSPITFETPRPTHRMAGSGVPGPASIPVSELRASAQRQPEPVSVPAPPAQHPGSEPMPEPDGAADTATIVFLGHQIQAEKAQRVRITVAVGWAGKRFEGSAVTADVSRSRLNAFASAALAAVREVIGSARESGFRVGGELSLDGIREVDTLGRKFVLVSVHAVEGPGVQTLAGTAVVDESPERAVVLATLQATDRWVRGPV